MSEISMRGGNTNSHFMPIPSDFYASSGTFANITGLQNNREYRFRLAVTTIHGEQIYSDTISLHTRTTHNYEHQQHEEHNEKVILFNAHPASSLYFLYFSMQLR
jgi:hypothetical protein